MKNLSESIINSVLAALIGALIATALIIDKLEYFGFLEIGHYKWVVTSVHIKK